MPRRLKPAARFPAFAALALVLTWPTLRTAGAMNDFWDAQVLRVYEDGARRAVLDHGQLPLWNPYYCGGMYGLGTPQGRFGSPAFLLSLTLGVSRGEALLTFLMVLLALEGAYRYLRARRVRPHAAVLAAPVFGASGIFAAAPALGWHNFLSFALLPWALYGARRAARHDLRWAGLAASALALAVAMGGTYPAPLIALACAFELATHRPGKRPLAAAGVLVLLGLGLAAYRLLPVIETLQRAPRLIGGAPGNAPTTLNVWLMGAWPPLTHFSPFLVGVPAACVAALALRKRANAWLALPLAASVWLALGYWPSLSAFGALRALPVFEHLRYPERFLVLAALVLALGAGRALTAVTGRLAQLAAAALLANLIFQVVNFHLAARGRSMVAPPAEVERDFHQARGNRWAAALYPPMSRGSLSCWEAYRVPMSPLLRGDLPSELYLEDASAGAVTQERWSPNALAFTAALSRPARVVVNQNHHTGWRSSAGEVVSHLGLLAVELPAGPSAVSLSFRPRSAVAGALTTGAALLALGWLVRRRRHPLAVLGASALPLGAGLLACWLYDEPAWRPPEPRGPAGEVLVVEAPPASARLLGARFEGGVTLEAVQVDVSAEPRQVRVELDWRREVKVNPRLGVRVRLSPGNHKADHAQLSGELALEQAPAGKTLRDLMVLDVPAGHRGERWTVWVGLWELRGDASRLRVLEAPGVKVHDDLIEVASFELP